MFKIHSQSNDHSTFIVYYLISKLRGYYISNQFELFVDIIS